MRKLFILVAAVVAIQIHSMESPESPITGALNKLWKLIEQDCMLAVKNSIERINTKGRVKLTKEGFVIIGQLQADEVGNKADRYLKLIFSQLNQGSQAQLKTALETVEGHVAELQLLSDSVASVQLRIADNVNQLHAKVKESLAHLDKVGVSIDGAYEALQLSKNKRYELDQATIHQQYKKLTEQYRDAGNKALENKVRQAGFTLANPESKKIYDAFLSGEDHLAMLLITPQDAECFDINFGQLSYKLSMCKHKLQELKKKIAQELGQRVKSNQ